MSAEVCVYELSDPATGRVFYVGMGSEKRGRDHVNETRRWLSGRGVFGTNLHKLRVIARMLSEGRKPEFKIVLRTPVRKEACDLERALIRKYGPALTNQLPGGEGGRFPGFAVSDETRAKISATLMGRKLSPEHVAKMKGRVPWNKGVPATAESIRRLSESHIGKSPTPETLALRSAAIKAAWKSERTRQLHREATSRRMASGWQQPPVTDEMRRRISEAQRGRKQSAETIEKRAASIRAGYANGSHVPYWRGRTGPNTGRTFSAETRRRMSESRRGQKCSPESVFKRAEAIKAHYRLHPNPLSGRKLTAAHRENMARGIRAYWAARRAERQPRLFNV